jgi:hypothetical protein
MADPERYPLSPAQRQTATQLPWYRAWLLSTGRTDAELDPKEATGARASADQHHPATADQHALPADAAAGDRGMDNTIPDPTSPPQHPHPFALP